MRNNNHCLIRYLLLQVIVFTGFSVQRLYAQQPTSFPTMEQLDEKYKDSWNDARYAAANSAATESYLTNAEKRVLYYLNLARMNPKLFAATYAVGYQGAQGYGNNPGFENNRKSLIRDLKKLDSLPVLRPSRDMYNYALCQASGVVKNKVTGNVHDRSLTGCPVIVGGFGENIFPQANMNALDIVMGFLIDAGVPSLGHRTNALNPAYHFLGASIQHPGQPGQCAVLDFTF